MRPEAVIFDCDGTLVDSEPLGLSALLEVAAEHGALVRSDQALEPLRGRKMADCVTWLEERCALRLPADFVPRVRQRTAEHFRLHLRPFDGALALLAALRVPFCVASSGPREKIELSLRLTGLLPYLQDRIFSAYEVGSWKPNPGLFLHAARSLGVEPSNCAVVEDSQPGVDAGLAAGMHVFVFGDAPVTLPLDARARVVRSHAELLAILCPPDAKVT